MSEGQVGTVEQHHVEGGEDPRGLQILLTVGGEGQGSQQLWRKISPSQQRKTRQRQDQHIEDQEASYVFFNIERPTGEQDTQILQLAAVSGHPMLQIQCFSVNTRQD